MILIRVHRAFEDLGHLPDGDCKRFLRHVCTRMGRAARLTPFVVGVVAIGLWSLTIVAEPAVMAALPLWPWPMAIQVVAVLTGAVASGGVAFLLSRDVIVWMHVRRELDTARCPKCRSSLVGLPISYVGVDASVPGKSFVRCPECGVEHNLLEIGLRPRDLVPFEQRCVAADYGAIRSTGARV